MTLHDELIAQTIREQAERTAKILRAMRLLDTAEAMVECGFTLEACGYVGKAREVAKSAGLI